MLAATLVLLAQLHGAVPSAPAVEPPTLWASVAGGVLDVSVGGREAGPVEVWDGDHLVAVLPAGAGTARLRTNAVPTSARLVARRGDQESRPVDLGTPPDGRTGTLVLAVPAGALTVASAADPPGRGDRWVTVSDTRAGDLGFQVRVEADRPATLVAARASQVPGNALRAQDVAVLDHGERLLSGVAVTVAHYPAGLGTGSVRIGAVLRGPREPDAVRVVWTAL